MTDRIASRAIAWLSATLQVTTALFFHGLVLCVGPGGHAAVEWFAADDCCPQTTAMSVERAGCCDCTDASLLQPAADKRDSNDVHRAAAFLPAAATSTGSPDQTGASPCARPPSPPGDRVLRRSVVLQL